MLNELERINFIVNEFMFIAKPHGAAYQHEDTAKIINDVVMLLNAQAALEGVIIESSIQQDLPPIYCNAGQLKQVVLNLLKNAIEAMPSGGTIYLKTCLTKESKILIQVVDQGTGIPKERTHRLGEPFYTTKDSGTGLGLMVSYKIIEAHGGEMIFESCPNAGTKVNIYLPCGVKGE
jgi:signal transduction histidine kinase